MRVLSLVHQPDAASGVFADAVAEAGHELDEWLVPRRKAPPAPLDDYGAVLVFGGAMHVDQEDRHRWLRDELDLLRRLLADDVPVFGVCLGGQLLAKALEAPVRRMPSPEVGWFDVTLTPEAAGDPVFGGLPERFSSFQWHTYEFELPGAAVALARNDRCLQAFRAGGSAWAIQFHAEVTGESVEEWTLTSKPEDDGAVDFARLAAESRERIPAWNALGKELCGRFLEVAESATRSAATTRATSRRS
ncbi:MAG: type 1 glutamine amidotransferase [Gaiellaceae bacterium]